MAYTIIITDNVQKNGFAFVNLSPTLSSGDGDSSCPLRAEWVRRRMAERKPAAFLIHLTRCWRGQCTGWQVHRPTALPPAAARRSPWFIDIIIIVVTFFSHENAHIQWTIKYRYNWHSARHSRSASDSCPRKNRQHGVNWNVFALYFTEIIFCND